MEHPLIVSASGIRGIVGRTMTPELAARYGAALGAFLLGRAKGPAGWVLVGRDSRTSGALLADAAAAGLRAAGVDVRTAGIAPTPTHLLFVRDHPDAIGGLIVTASHNPVEWNGLKLAAGQGRFVSPEEGARIQTLFEEEPPLSGWDALGGLAESDDVVEHHVGRILGLGILETDAIRSWAPRVALDCVHGAGGVILPELLRRLGCAVEGIGLEPDGRFPREPEPVPENLGALGDLVRATGADLGLAVDPDSDRLSIVDEEGRPLGEDWTLALAAEYVLDRRPGPVVTNLSSSQCIEDVARAANVPFRRSAVGEARVAAEMAATGAVVGGEGNGGVMLPELNLTRDAPMAAALVLAHCAVRGRRPDALLEGRRRYAMTKRKVARPPGGVEATLDAVAASFGTDGEKDRTDGLRISWSDRAEWVHVRPSGTEPVVRVIAEAPSAERSRELADRAERSVLGSD